MRRFFIRYLVLSTIIWPSAVFACSCGSYSLIRHYDSQPYALTAVITGVRPENEEYVRYTMAVTDHIKGKRAGNELVTNQSTSMCGAPLIVGREYALFLNDSNKIGLCSGATLLDKRRGTETRQILSELKAGRTPDFSPAWSFSDNHGLCTLGVTFTRFDELGPDHDRLDFFFRYAFNPHQIAFGNEAARPGYLAAHVRLRPYRHDDQSRFALISGGQTFPAVWRKNVRGSRGTYRIFDAEVESLLNAIYTSKALRFDSLMLGKGLKGEIKTSRIGSSLDRFTECVKQSGH